MAGLLFLFFMQAMDESFKKQCAHPEPEFWTHRDSKRGPLLKQPVPAKTKGVPFHFGKSMFADDAAYILSSQQELTYDSAYWSDFDIGECSIKDWLKIDQDLSIFQSTLPEFW
jgi:hypothetical protein